jgi:hypothetical protein
VDVQKKKRRAKKPSPAVLDGTVLRSLPVPCRIEVAPEAGPPQAFDVDEPELQLEFDHPGTYRVTITAVPYLPAELEVVVP